MTRGADRLLRHFAGSSLESAQQQQALGRPVQRQMSNAVFVYRQPFNSSTETDSNWSLSLARDLSNATGRRLRPIGSIVRRNPRTVRGVAVDRPPTGRALTTSNPPSPPVDPTFEDHSMNSQNHQHPPRERPKSPVPTISIAEEGELVEERPPSYIGNGQTTADELMKILMEDDGTERPVIFTIFEAANIDGVKHLSSKSRCTRYTWFVLIILFICLCFYQIGAQAVMYWLTPVATNIIAAYPDSLSFPVIAVCNNNQHRLSWLTADTVQGRRPRNPPPNGFRRQLNESDVFDKVLLNNWDMDAGKFLRNAAHQRGRMIVRCELPNGSRCSPRDFRPFWTLTGLCWAINTDPENPLQVTGAGPGNALRLLVNVERYERVESCTPKLRTSSLPSIKVLIINQTDIPASYLEGVNVPAGFTMDIPFWMRQRQKLPGRDCVVLNSPKDGQTAEEEEKDRREKEDLRSCLMSSYLSEIERRCNCSMRQAYLKQVEIPHHQGEWRQNVAPCNVMQYFECVNSVLEWAKNNGFRNFRQCPVPCESIDYTAWQDMNELPTNIFPQLVIGHYGDGDEEDSGEEDEVDMLSSEGATSKEDTERDERDEDKHYQCTHNQMLSESVVRRIKKAAQGAFEKQAQYQEDIQIRTRHLIDQLRQSVQRLVEMQLGWRPEDFMSIHQQLAHRLKCYEEMPMSHPDVFNALANPKPQGEEDRARQLEEMLQMGAEKAEHGVNESRMGEKTIEEVKRKFGAKAEERHQEMVLIRELTNNIYSLFSPDTFIQRLPRSLERMDRVLQMSDQFEKGQMSRKNWAERMQTRNMRHFLEEVLYESWYNLIVRDLEQNVLETVQKIEDAIPKVYRKTENGTALLTGSILLFGDFRRGSMHIDKWAAFLDDALECIFRGIRNESVQVLKEFQRAMHELQSVLVALFLKELPEYLQNFEFGPKFVKENFAQVNVFLHKMNIENWRQEPTYSIWSFFCDIGATMSLFLGASMLTIIEVLYFVVQQSRIYRSIAVWRQRKNPPMGNNENGLMREGQQQKQKGDGGKNKKGRSPSFMLV